jgi:hypothetical protein
MLNRSKLWATTLLIGVFAAGIAVGGPVWGALGDDGHDGRNRRGGSAESRGRERKSYSEHLQEDLNLSLEQRAAVDSILALSQSDMRTAWRDLRARIDTLRQDVAEEIMLLLDAEQQAKYREMIEQSRRRGDRERAPKDNRHHD